MDGFETAYADFVTGAGLTSESARVYKSGVKSAWGYISSLGVDPLLATERDLEEWVGSVSSRLSAATCRLYLSSVKAFYKWLSDETEQPNPASGLRANGKRNEISQPHALSPTKVRVVLKACKTQPGAPISDLRDEAVTRLMMLSFIRPTEIAEANVGDFRRSGTRHALVLRHKGGVKPSGVIPIDNTTASVIRLYLELRGSPSGDAPLFASVAPRNPGGRLTTKSVSRIMNASLSCVGEASGTVNFIKTAMGMALAAGADDADVRSFARMRSFRAVMGSAEAAAHANKHVGEFISEFVEGEHPAAVTVGSIRQMLAGLDDDERILISVDSGGDVVIGYCEN